MALSNDEVRHVAMLARLDLADDEVERLSGQLSAILEYAEQVGELATGDVDATSHPYPLQNVFRADVPRPSIPKGEALRGAPQAEDGQFAVPQIVGED